MLAIVQEDQGRENFRKKNLFTVCLFVVFHFFYLFVYCSVRTVLESTGMRHWDKTLTL